VPLLPASLIEPVWVEFAALIGADQQPEFSPTHPWGCHRRRISDRVVFDHLIAALVRGSGYERIATPGCSDRTIRRRLRDWAQAGHTKVLLRLVLAAFDRMIGLDLDDLSVDGSITKSPCGGEVWAPSGSWPATGAGSRYTWSPHEPTITTCPCWNPRWPGSAT
jgi:hypothetical protein